MLNTLISYKKRTKLLGRGRASGKGKTSGRGHKGQKARTGKKLRAGFEGGQTPIFQRIPKYRGFKNINRVEYQVVNLDQLESLKEDKIDREVLLKHRLIRHKKQPVKVLGNGVFSRPLEILLDKASQSAIDKIGKAGGKFISTAKNIIEAKTSQDKDK